MNLTVSLCLISVFYGHSACSRLMTASELSEESLVVSISPDILNTVLRTEKRFKLESHQSDGQHIYETAKTMLTQELAPRDVRFDCQDLRFINGRDLKLIVHRLAFSNAGVLPLIATESVPSDGQLHVNLHLPIITPEYEETLAEMFASEYSKEDDMKEQAELSNLSDFLREVADLEENELHMDFAKLSFIKHCHFHHIKLKSKSCNFPSNASSIEFVKWKANSFSSLIDGHSQSLENLVDMISLEKERNATILLKSENLSAALGKAKSKTTKYRTRSSQNQAELVRVRQATSKSQAELQFALEKNEALILENRKMKFEVEKLKLEISKAHDLVEAREASLLQSISDAQSSKEQTLALELKLKKLDDLLKQLSYSNALATTFSGPNFKELSLCQLYHRHQFSHTSTRFSEISDPSVYSENGLNSCHITMKRTLWMETYYAEGKRLQTWLHLVGDKDWRNQFGFEPCYTSFSDDVSEDKMKRKLIKMAADISRLQKRMAEVIEGIKDKCQGHEDNELVAKFLADDGDTEDPDNILAVLAVCSNGKSI